MKVLTAAEMREVDRLTMEGGISGPVLMENAGCRVVEFLELRFAPLAEHRIVIFCGKGNNGGDGLVIARQLESRYKPRWVRVIRVEEGIPSDPELQQATLVIDALLGTGLQGPARGKALDGIRAINTGFPQAKVIAVDLPSGMQSDSGRSDGEVARADYTVTFTAPKIAHAMPPNCDQMGEVAVAEIGSPLSLYEHIALNITEPREFASLLARRALDSSKGSFGHVLVVGGAAGKTGAAHMTGLAALRMGAGLVTIASAKDWFVEPELMTAPLPASYEELMAAASRMDVLAIGPGLGNDAAMVTMAERTYAESALPCVFDADGLNALAGKRLGAPKGLRVLTPHPGEMARLAGRSVPEVQGDRLSEARTFAQEQGCVLVLKGHRSVIAFPDGSTWINPTGTPALAKGGSGDVLTGMIAGMLAQHPEEPRLAVIAAVYLQGLAAQLGVKRWTDRCLLATDLFEFLPEAIRVCAPNVAYR
jgi:ADP-dependent NAD(P)H-hydrate dehydratase / NAD(P)H-hydrate epimerase